MSTFCTAPPPPGGHSREVWVEVCRWHLPTLFRLGRKQFILLPCLIASGTNRHPVQDTKWWIYIPCLRLKTLENIPCSVAQTCVGQIKKSPWGTAIDLFIVVVTLWILFTYIINCGKLSKNKYWKHWTYISTLSVKGQNRVHFFNYLCRWSKPLI